jgi:ribosomal subunit interface protein
MNINFKTKGVDINSDVREDAERKASSLVKFLGNDPENVRFDIEFTEDTKRGSGDVYRVDIVAIAGKVDMHAVGHGESYMAAIDVAKDDLARRLSRSKDKDRNMLRKGSRMIKRMLRMGE